MRYGIIHHVAGNVAALTDIEQQFSALGVRSRFCLGNVVGLYPFVDQSVDYLISHSYCVLKHVIDEAFINDGPWDGWSCTHLVEALKYTRPRTSDATIAFLRAAPTDIVSHGWRFTARFPTYGRYLSFEQEAEAAFATYSEQLIFHGSDRYLRVCLQDGRVKQLGVGKHQLDRQERQLVSPGCIGGKYWGSDPPSAVVFDEEAMTIEVLRPKLSTGAVLGSLVGSEYPKDVLRYLMENEFRC